MTFPSTFRATTTSFAYTSLSSLQQVPSI